MKIDLRYGCNPHQGQASVSHDAGPLRVRNGAASYINLLDALGAWQLVRELKEVTGKAAAASFKHVSPAGAAISGELSERFVRSQFLRNTDLSDVANAYVRARGGDRMCSFGDAAAVSEVVDESLANVLASEVSDLLIAPGFEPAALETLKKKKKGAYLLLEIDPDYEGPELEHREVFGFSFTQERNRERFTRAMFDGLPDAAAESLLVASVALKYTQSNSVAVACEGQVIGIGAGQQSRIHCTRLACDKADKWMLQSHPNVLGLPFKSGTRKVDKANIVDQFLLYDELSDRERADLGARLDGTPSPLTREDRRAWIEQFDSLVLASDAYIPFRDNIDRAAHSNVRYVGHPGGSVRDEEVAEAATEYGIAIAETGIRSFLH
ncbi:MAG: 5-aminoimidazole-4-carboxamide ribonucleotide transformylase [Gammaproteobacteria bacterium]|nr:5-aminoimidazole-4-carboxamide ribonucleotide transformylase [Gammaproteobacteria bacterium]|tara:strand:- start:1379 stop:2521 length:1143 start_codon:yes stop_codon:yes gene_type:complete